MSNRLWALLAATGATLIYGLNHTVAKVVMPDAVGAFGFIFIRTAGAAILFWSLSLFMPRQKNRASRLLADALGRPLGYVHQYAFFF